jgi:hypothetical protein
MSSAPRELLATAGATTSLARQLGFSLGPGLATTTWAVSGYTTPGMRTAMVIAAVLAALALLCLSRDALTPQEPVRVTH